MDALVIVFAIVVFFAVVVGSPAWRPRKHELPLHEEITVRLRALRKKFRA